MNQTVFLSLMFNHKIVFFHFKNAFCQQDEFPQNDFIFAVVCEELGFIGAALILLLFALLIWRGFVIAMNAPDKFGSVLAIGLTAQIGIQVILNIAVVTNSMPNTGISLPFFSYGGTSLVSCMGLIGLIQGVASVNQDDLAYDYEISHTLQEEAMMPEADRE